MGDFWIGVACGGGVIGALAAALAVWYMAKLAKGVWPL